MAFPRRISDIKPTITNLAQTSHYQVIFGGLPDPLISFLGKRGVDSRFIAENLGLLCFSASLPTTSLGNANILGNYMGITENFAYRRIYSEITLEFYVDNNYKTLKFLEHWMEFISSGSHNPINGVAGPINQNSDAYFIRMQYPDYYKSNSTRIIKFDRDYRAEIEYNFRGMYPSNLSSVPVYYANSEILKVSSTFSYDRYIAGRVNSINEFRLNSNNLNSGFAAAFDPTRGSTSRLATGREELLWRNRNEGTGRLDDSRPRGIGGPIVFNDNKPPQQVVSSYTR